MRIELRSPTPDDALALAPLVTDPDVRRWNPMTPADPARWIEMIAQDDEQSATFAVWDVAGDHLVGVVSLFSIDRTQGTAEIGYRVLPAQRGRGIATAAVQAAADHGFRGVGLRRIQLFHAVANPASCRVAQRAGFQLEGTLRQSYVYGDGAAHDEHLHARLRST